MFIYEERTMIRDELIIKELVHSGRSRFLGLGIATAALHRFWTEIIPHKTKENIYAEVNAENYKSIRVLENNGFSRVGEFAVDSERIKYLYSKNNPLAVTA